MKNNFARCLNIVVSKDIEGGFVNNVHDKGGPTNLGVTQHNWEAFTGRPVTEQDMRALTPQIVSPFYLKNYWLPINGDSLPIGLDLCVFQFGVVSGPDRAAKYLQLLVKTAEDGIIGQGTLSATQAYFNDHGCQNTIDMYLSLQLSYLKDLSDFKYFGTGWQRRVDIIRAAAKTMCPVIVH